MEWENNIKSKLEERTIAPQNSTWEKLEIHLDYVDNKPKTRFIWTGIAALFILGYFIFSPFYENSNRIIEVSKYEGKINIQKPIENQEMPLLVQEESQNEQEKEELSTEILTTPEKPKLVLVVKEKSAIEKEEIPFTNIDFILPPETPAQKEPKEWQAMQILEKEVFPENQTEKDEIDLLLEKANERVIITSLLTKSSNEISAESLLEQIELDEIQPDRNRLIKSLENGWNYAVSNSKKIKSRWESNSLFENLK